MVSLVPFTAPLHRIEEIVARLRSHQLPYHTYIGDFLLLTTDEIEKLLAGLISSGQVNEERRGQLCQVAEDLLVSAKPDNVAQEFEKALFVLGKRSQKAEPILKSAKVLLELPADLDLMRSLSLHIDNLSIYRKNRSDQTVQMTQQLNEALGTPVNPEQLQAAAWMHDVGMGFIPHNIFNKEGTLSKEELRKIQEHVITGSQLLLRFGDWNEAARMVLDHHERFDGSGYPNGVAGKQIHPGARMLSIVDTFCSITTERSDRNFKKSLLSAISEINANSESQFDPDMVAVFNEVIRKVLMKQT